MHTVTNDMNSEIREDNHSPLESEVSLSFFAASDADIFIYSVQVASRMSSVAHCVTAMSVGL